MRPARPVAVVTGAASGIGRALALRLATDGLDVAVLDLADGSDTVEAVRAAGARATDVRCDVSDPGDVAAAVATVRTELGPPTVLVANAGIYPVAPFAETTFETWRRIMSVNLDSLFLLTQQCLPDMRDAGWGRIVVTATNGFWTGLPQLTPYVASKGGAIGFVRSLAGEIGEFGVTINAFAPSLTETPGTTQGVHEALGLFERTRAEQAIHRTGQPQDVAGVVSFLVSEDAAFLTGQTIAVDGGMVRG